MTRPDIEAALYVAHVVGALVFAILAMWIAIGAV